MNEDLIFDKTDKNGYITFIENIKHKNEESLLIKLKYMNNEIN